MPIVTDRSEMSAEAVNLVHQFIENELLMGQGVEFHDDDSLLEDGIIDSLGLLDIVTFIETEFDVTVDDADVTLDNFGTVKTIASFVETKKAMT